MLERKRLIEAWKNKSKQYWDQFDKIKKKLPQKFVTLFESGQLHDSGIESIHLDKVYLKNAVRVDINLVIKFDQMKGELTHCDVRDFNCNIKDLYEYTNRLEYLYGEILMNKDGLFVHDFLISNGNEITIKYKSLKWKDLTVP